jgi:RimJ/RimL family protein N-acetyltransferase
MQTKNTPVPHTPRLTLRPFEEGDRDGMLSMLTDGEIKKTYMISDFDTPEKAEGMFRRFAELSRDNTHFVYAISLGDEIIGFLNDVDRTDTSLEMGYVVSPAHWGNGFATEAFTAVIEELFAAGFDTVRAGAFVENTASMRVMEKCGMTRQDYTDTIDYRGITHTCIYYAITKGA